MISFCGLSPDRIDMPSFYEAVLCEDSLSFLAHGVFWSSGKEQLLQLQKEFGLSITQSKQDGKFYFSYDTDEKDSRPQFLKYAFGFNFASAYFEKYDAVGRAENENGSEKDFLGFKWVRNEQTARELALRKIQ